MRKHMCECMCHESFCVCVLSLCAVAVCVSGEMEDMGTDREREIKREREGYRDEMEV